MEKIAITSAYQEQFGSLLVRQVRNLVTIDEDLWTNQRKEIDWMRSPSETVSETANETLCGLCRAMDNDELSFNHYDKSHRVINLNMDGLVGNLVAEWTDFYARERFPDFCKVENPYGCEDWVQPDSAYDWDVGGPLRSDEWPKQSEPEYNWEEQLVRERHFGRFLVQRVHDVAVRECDKWLAPDAKGPKADRFRNGKDPCFALYPNIVDMTIYLLLRAIGNGEIGMIWSPDRYADNPVGIDLTYNKDLAGLYLRKWRKEHSAYPWHNDFAEEEAL